MIRTESIKKHSNKGEKELKNIEKVKSFLKSFEIGF